MTSESEKMIFVEFAEFAKKESERDNPCHERIKLVADSIWELFNGYVKYEDAIDTLISSAMHSQNPYIWNVARGISQVFKNDPHHFMELTYDYNRIDDFSWNYVMPYKRNPEFKKYIEENYPVKFRDDYVSEVSVLREKVKNLTKQLEEVNA